MQKRGIESPKTEDTKVKSEKWDKGRETGDGRS